MVSTEWPAHARPRKILVARSDHRAGAGDPAHRSIVHNSELKSISYSLGYLAVAATGLILADDRFRRDVDIFYTPRSARRSWRHDRRRAGSNPGKAAAPRKRLRENHYRASPHSGACAPSCVQATRRCRPRVPGIDSVRSELHSPGTPITHHEPSHEGPATWCRPDIADCRARPLSP